jgi:hypothetical protein
MEGGDWQQPGFINYRDCFFPNPFNAPHPSSGLPETLSRLKLRIETDKCVENNMRQIFNLSVDREPFCKHQLTD